MTFWSHNLRKINIIELLNFYWYIYIYFWLGSHSFILKKGLTEERVYNWSNYICESLNKTLEGRVEMEIGPIWWLNLAHLAILWARKLENLSTNSIYHLSKASERSWAWITRSASKGWKWKLFGRRAVTRSMAALCRRSLFVCRFWRIPGPW